jgi:transposase
MTKSSSLDLRRRVARFVEAEHSCHEAARHFEVSVAFVVRLMAAYRATGSLAAKPEGGWRSSKLDPHRELLIRRVAEKGDLTMPQLAAELAALGTKVTPASISRWFIRQGYSFKKRMARPVCKWGAGHSIKRCGPANKDAPTCARPASTGAPNASRACARSRIGSSFSMRPARPPRRPGCVDALREASACMQKHPSGIG